MRRAVRYSIHAAMILAVGLWAPELTVKAKPGAGLAANQNDASIEFSAVKKKGGGGAKAHSGGAKAGGKATAGRNTNVKSTNIKKQTNVKSRSNVNVNRNANVNVNRNVNVVNRPVRGWVSRPYYGTMIGGVALGTVIAVSAAGAVPAAPGPNACWYWSDPNQIHGYWDYCNPP
jgi:hypothetical protein